ncbi:MAG: response regulator transcription factor [Rhodospirillales bacterium]|nr:response regulator transcription factor [Rhodospirillales bacterium]
MSVSLQGSTGAAGTGSSTSSADDHGVGRDASVPANPGKAGAETGRIKSVPHLVLIDPRLLTRALLGQFFDTNVRGLKIIAVSSLQDFLRQKTDSNTAIALIVFYIAATEIGDSDLQGDIQALKSVFPDIPFVVMSDHDDPRHVVEALRCGVRGYIPTTIHPHVAVEALRLVQAGGTFIPASALDAALKNEAQKDENDDIGQQRDLTAGLTPRELEVLALLRQGRSNKTIAYDLEMHESTVKVHVRHIMRKLKATNRTQAAFFANKLINKGSSTPSDGTGG